MQLGTFLAAFKRSWLVALLLVEGAIFGSVLYTRTSNLPMAQATVAVRDPLTVRPSDYQAAQVTFDAIIASRRLSQQVAERLETTPDEVEGRLEVEVVAAESGMNISPLYAVRGKAPNEDAALKLVDVTVEEARRLYIELNGTDAADVSTTLGAERAEADRKYADAEARFVEFTRKNDAAALPTTLQALTAQVTALQDRVSQASADLAAMEAARSGSGILVARDRLKEFQGQLRQAQMDLDKLRSLEAEYTALTEEVAAARSEAQSLAQFERTLIVAQLMPLSAQVKVLDTARVQPQTLKAILTHSLGVILGLMAAITVVYLEALRAQQPETVETVAASFDGPVLVRIPAGAVPGTAR